MSDGSYPSFSLLAQTRYGSSHPNPTFDFLSGFAPRKLKDLFRWVEYLYYNSAHIFAALKKFSEYPITDVTFPDNVEEGLKKSWTRILDDVLNMKAISIKTGLDLQLYGNSFISVYKPFNRYLICGSCKQQTNIKKVKSYKFKLKTITFSYKCPSCGSKVNGTIKDEPVQSEKRINVIRWDPKLMDINHNAITGESVYYYTLSQDIKSRIQRGDKHIINTMPKEFLQAVKSKKTFEFAPGQIYHMKVDPPAGVESHWGFPPLTATIKLFFYAAVLRKANEAIALDHIVPFRVLHPAPISGNADPAQMMSLNRWQQELEQNIKRWRRDPLHIMFAPAALGVTMMGGQGKALMTLGEVQEAEANIIAAMGIPKEFLYGGLSFTGSAITLRMLENQLATYTGHLNRQLNWIIKQTGKILSIKPLKAEYTPFKLVDDSEQKQLLIQLNQMKPLVSDSTIMSMMDIDVDDERDKRKQETLTDARWNVEVQEELTKLQNNLALKARREAQSGEGLSYNPQAVIARAEEIVQLLMQKSDGERKSVMSHLSQEDPVMYAVVKDRLATMQALQKKQSQGAV